MNARQVFRALLRLLPFDFRADYGRDMEQVFQEQHREASRQGGSAVASLWAEAVADLLRTGPREHLAQLREDAGLAVRALLRRPGFTAAALATLALGVGANTAVFSVVQAVLLRPLPYAQPDRLLALWNRWEGSPRAALSVPEFLDYAERSRALQVAAMASGTASLSGAGPAERLSALYVTPNILDVVGRAPELGRGFLREEEVEGRHRVAILSEAAWKRLFGGDRNVIGRTVMLDGESHEIVGVAPADLRLPREIRRAEAADVILPLPLDRAAPRQRRGGHFLQAVARLAPGASQATAQAEMDTILAGLARQYPDQHDQGGFGIVLLPLHEDLLGASRPVLLVLGGCVALVLLVTCANVAGLLLARGEGRRRELAVRAALGADRFRLLRQILTEACVLAAAGAALGVLVAHSALKALTAIDPAGLPRLESVRLDLPVLLFTAAVSLLAGLASGLLPALQATRADAGRVLGEESRGSTGGRAFARQALVAAQVAVAVVLLVGAGLLLKSFGRLQGVPAGFDPEGVLTVRLAAPEAGYPGRPEVTAFYGRMLDEVRALPGVEVAGAGSGLPLAVGSGDWSLDVEGRPLLEGKHHGAPDWFVVTPGYFEALRVKLVQGRLPAPSDDAGAAPVLFLNESAARALFPHEDPIGHRVKLTSTTAAPQPWRTIAGVVGDVRHRGLDRPARPEMYFAHPQFQHFMKGAQARDMNLVLRTALEPSSLAAALRAAVARVDPGVPAADLQPMDRIVADSLAERRRNLWIVGAFGALTVSLASVGLYGLLAYTVSQRRREIGVRVALGATRGDVLRLVVGQGARLVQIGLAVGLVLAIPASGALRALLFEVVPRDVAVFGSVAALLAAVGLVASAVPAWRAARIPAAVALRQE